MSPAVTAGSLTASGAPASVPRSAILPARPPISVLLKTRRSLQVACVLNSAPGRAYPSRRDVLGAGAALLLAVARVPEANAEEISDDELRASILISSSVVPALSTQQYVDAIDRSRPVAWSEIEGDIEREEFERLGASLLFGPFDEVKQSAFFLPWAILKTDTQAALRAREAYLVFEAAVEQLDRSSAAGAKLLVEPSDVKANFDAVSVALDNLLAQVPTN